MKKIEWRISSGLIPYPQALALMEERVHLIQEGLAPPLIWLLEHPPLYTAGTSATEDHFLEPPPFPVYATGRGGKMTYHGPGQRIIYILLDLKNYSCDLRWYVHQLEEWILKALSVWNISGERIAGQVGVWVSSPPPFEERRKIAAIGIRVKKWVTLHGIALNINPDLDPFTSIIPCGLKEAKTTSLSHLSCPVSPQEVDQVLYKTCPFLSHL